MADCIFCKIIEGQIPSTPVYQDAQFIVIKDLYPQAKVHLLVIPKKHVESLAGVFDGKQEATLESQYWMGRMLEVGVKVAHEQGLLPNGFRSVINTNADGGQTVFHLHMHVLGGEALSGRFA